MIPKLSISVPTYNRAAILDDLLWNIGPQVDRCYPDCVCFVIDNDSTDQTAEVVEAHSRRWRGMNYRKNAQNVGLVRNIAQAIVRSEAEWIWLMGDDDVPMPWAIQTLLEELATLEKTSKASVMLLNGSKVDETKKLCPETWNHVHDFESDLTIFSNGAEILKAGGIHSLAWLSKLVVRKAAWDQPLFESLYKETDLYTFVRVIVQTAFSQPTAYSRRLYLVATDSGSRSYYFSKTAIARVYEFPEIERAVVSHYGRAHAKSILANGRQNWLQERAAFALKIAVLDDHYANQLDYLRKPISPFLSERLLLRFIFILTRIQPVKRFLRRLYEKRRGGVFEVTDVNRAT